MKFSPRAVFQRAGWKDRHFEGPCPSPTAQKRYRWRSAYRPPGWDALYLLPLETPYGRPVELKRAMYAEATDLASLHLSLLQRMGVQIDEFGTASAPLAELTG